MTDQIITQSYAFHRDIVKIPFPDQAQMLTGERLEFGLKCLREEAQELEDATSFNEQVDAILDLTYFAMGRLYEMGITEESVMKFYNSIHEANLTKAKGKTKRGSEFDAAKPDDFKPPFHDIAQARE